MYVTLKKIIYEYLLKHVDAIALLRNREGFYSHKYNRLIASILLRLITAITFLLVVNISGQWSAHHWLVYGATVIFTFLIIYNKIVRYYYASCLPYKTARIANEFGSAQFFISHISDNAEKAYLAFGHERQHEWWYILTRHSSKRYMPKAGDSVLVAYDAQCVEKQKAVRVMILDAYNNDKYCLLKDREHALLAALDAPPCA